MSIIRYIIVVKRFCNYMGVSSLINKLMNYYFFDYTNIIIVRSVCPDTVFHVSCTTSHLIMLADLMEIKKEDKEGFLRPVTEEEWTQFPESGRVGPLNISDIHRCVQYAIDRIHFDV